MHEQRPQAYLKSEKKHDQTVHTHIQTYKDVQIALKHVKRYSRTTLTLRMTDFHPLLVEVQNNTVPLKGSSGWFNSNNRNTHLFSGPAISLRNLFSRYTSSNMKKTLHMYQVVYFCIICNNKVLEQTNCHM